MAMKLDSSEQKHAMPGTTFTAVKVVPGIAGFFNYLLEKIVLSFLRRIIPEY